MSFASYHDEFTAFVQHKAHQCQGQNILDMGCGTGRLTQFFNQHNTVTGIDVDDNVTPDNRNFTFHRADGTALPFVDDSFDTIVSFDVIEHVTDDQAFIQEAHRVLRPGGRILFGTPNRDRFSHRLQTMLGRQIQYPLTLGVDPYVGECIHLREYTADELATYAQKAGFTSITVMPFWFGITAVPAGLVSPPSWLASSCQYYFLEATVAPIAN